MKRYGTIIFLISSITVAFLLGGCYATGTTEGRSGLAQAEMRSVSNGTAVSGIHPKYYFTAYVAAIDANGRAYRRSSYIHVFIGEHKMAWYALGGGAFSSRGEQVGPDFPFSSISNAANANLENWNGLSFLTNASGMTEKLFIAPRSIFEIDPAMNIIQEVAAGSAAVEFLKATFATSSESEKTAIAPSLNGSVSIEERLASLKKLLERGLINQSEFDREKAKLLEELRAAN